MKKAITITFAFIGLVFGLLFGSVSLFAAENNVSNVFWTFDSIVEDVDFGEAEYNNLDYDLLYLFIYNDNIGPDSRLGFVIYPPSTAQDNRYYWSSTVYLEFGLDYTLNGYSVQIIDVSGVGWSYSLYGITFTDSIDNYALGYKDGRNEIYHQIHEGGFRGFGDIDEPYLTDEGGFNYYLGLNKGVIAGENFNFANLLTQIFVGMGSLLAINLLPGISIGAIIAVPLVFGIIYFIIGKKRGDD